MSSRLKDITRYELKDFRPFQAKDFPYDASMAMIAPTKMGKTTALFRWLTEMYCPRYMALVISPECYVAYPKILHPFYVYPRFDDTFRSKLEEVKKMNTIKASQIEKEYEHRTERKELDAIEQQEQKWEVRMKELTEKAIHKGWDHIRLDKEAKRMRVEHDREAQYLAEVRLKEYTKMRDDMRREWSVTVILDDLKNEKGALEDKEWEGLLKAGRHAMIRQFYLVQDLFDIPSDRRGQFDFVATAPKMSAKRLKDLGENWLPPHKMTKLIPQMMQIFDKFLTHKRNDGGRTWLVINRTEQSTDPTKFIYRAGIPPQPILRRKRPLGSDATLYAAALYFDEKKYAAAETHGKEMLIAKVRQRMEEETQAMQASERRTSSRKSRNSRGDEDATEGRDAKTQPWSTFSSGDPQPASAPAWTSDHHHHHPFAANPGGVWSGAPPSAQDSFGANLVPDLSYETSLGGRSYRRSH